MKRAALLLPLLLAFAPVAPAAAQWTTTVCCTNFGSCTGPACAGLSDSTQSGCMAQASAAQAGCNSCGGGFSGGTCTQVGGGGSTGGGPYTPPEPSPLVPVDPTGYRSPGVHRTGGGQFDLGATNPLGPFQGEATLTSHYSNSFEDWAEEAEARAMQADEANAQQIIEDYGPDYTAFHKHCEAYPKICALLCSAIDCSEGDPRTTLKFLSTENILPSPYGSPAGIYNAAGDLMPPPNTTAAYEYKFIGRTLSASGSTPHLLGKTPGISKPGAANPEASGESKKSASAGAEVRIGEKQFVSIYAHKSYKRAPAGGPTGAETDVKKAVKNGKELTPDERKIAAKKALLEKRYEGWTEEQWTKNRASNVKKIEAQIAAGKAQVLGEPEAWKERAWRQTHGTCAIAAQLEILEHFGLFKPKGDETRRKFEDKLANEAYRAGASNDTTGSVDGDGRLDYKGTKLEAVGDLLKKRGLTVFNSCSPECAKSTTKELVDLVEIGVPVMVTVNSGMFWAGSGNEAHDASSNHVVVVTGVVRDSKGNPIGVYINDTGSGQANVLLPIDQFLHAWNGDDRQLVQVFEGEK